MFFSVWNKKICYVIAKGEEMLAASAATRIFNTQYTTQTGRQASKPKENCYKTTTTKMEAKERKRVQWHRTITDKKVHYNNS